MLGAFTNTTGDPVFDETLRQGLAIHLQQSPFLSLISEERIRKELALMEQPPDARLTSRLAQDVCVRTASAAVLEGSIATSRLEGVFEHVLSTDRAKTYKPAPNAYRLGLDAFGLPKGQILFVAFAGWDAAGAKAFGYPTFWVNRLGLPSEELGGNADAEGQSLVELTAYALG